MEVGIRHPQPGALHGRRVLFLDVLSSCLCPGDGTGRSPTRLKVDLGIKDAAEFARATVLLAVAVAPVTVLALSNGTQDRENLRRALFTRTLRHLNAQGTSSHS